jgi:UDP-4-amino-4,6-dideoxy-N-acetyl-beta-L-altrosamine transaminase
MIAYGRQQIGQDDIDAVLQVLTSDFLTQGPAGPAFEGAVVEFVQSDSAAALSAVAVNSATSALHIACMALEVSPGDLVWTCANSFAASANCARYCGADVDFVDIDAITLNMGIAALESKLEAAYIGGRLPKVVIPVDFAGRPAPMREIRQLADRYGFSIIEDASHAIGSVYLDKKTGAHGGADITIFSFHPVKIITTAEGGMAVTANPSLAQRMADLRTHGITRDAQRLVNADEGAWYYEQHALGYNYRLTDLQATLGRSQLTKIDRFIEARHGVRRFYEAALSDMQESGKLLLSPVDEPGCRSALHLYPIQVLPASGCTRREAFDALRDAGIGVNVHYLPIYLHPYYRSLGFAPGLCPEAERYYNRAISLPMHPGLDAGQLQKVVASVRSALS